MGLQDALISKDESSLFLLSKDGVLVEYPLVDSPILHPTPTPTVPPIVLPTPTAKASPTETPTPGNTPNPSPTVPVADTYELVHVFELDEMEQFTRVSGGFDGYAGGTVERKTIDHDASFDRTVISLQVGKGEVELLLLPKLFVEDKVHIVKVYYHVASSPAAIIVGALDAGMDGSIATNLSNRQNANTEALRTSEVYYNPPSNAFIPCFQVANLSEDTTAEVLLDRVEVYQLK
jgi:hypothetical protein